MGTSESVTYDAGGNTLTRTKADGKVIRYAYDADNRLTDIIYPTLHATHFDYDADNRKTHMTDATGTTSWYYGYDGVHLSQLASPGGCLTYVYDGDGRLSYKYLNLNNVFTYWYNAYDAGGRLTSLRSTLDGTTTFTYNPDDTLATKTDGNGNYDTYGYDTCDEVTSIGYYNPGGNYQNGLAYNYDPAGNRTFCNQNWYTTTYGYDGADQLVSETSGGTYPPPTLGYTYDHNGNRLTQSVNGSQTQSFGYDAHDKLISGTGETDSYDLNGNETSITLNGALYQMRWDDGDRLIGETLPSGIVDTFTYNGLGLRVGKTDSTGTYSFFCDGASPGSPVLSDGHAVYTPGLSESRGGVSTYAASDVLGNLWFMDNGGGQQTYYQDTTAFGSGAGMGLGGTEAGPFKFGGANGCQTDADTGLVLMGHRYYDTRIGRFISQDPAGSGDNWYAYADNDPVDEVDPDGLISVDEGNREADALVDSADYNGEEIRWNDNNNPYFKDDNGVIHSMGFVNVPAPSGGLGMGGGMSPFTESYQRPGESNTHYFFRGLWWAIKQVATFQPDPVLGAVRGPDGRFVRDPDATKSPDFNTKKARKIWEKAKGRPWPKDPTTGNNFEVHHIQMRSQGGALYDSDNITPVHPDMHQQLHRPGGPY